LWRFLLPSSSQQQSTIVSSTIIIIMTSNNAITRPTGLCCIGGCTHPSMELLHRCFKCQNYVHVLCAEPFKPDGADVADDSFWCDKCSVQKEQSPQKQPAAKQQKRTTSSPSDRCSVRNCPITGLEKFPCANPDCKKLAHLMCYQGVILKQNKLDPLPNCKICCCKKCYFLVAGSVNDDDDDGIETGKRGSWECDGLGGPADPNTSQKILLDWWLTEGNYAKYCGKGNDGVKKTLSACSCQRNDKANQVEKNRP